MIEFAGIHILRPWFLLAIPAGLLLVWWLQNTIHADERRVDPQLRDHALVGRNPRHRRYRSMLLTAIVLLAALSLSGPGWKEIEIPAKRSANPTFVLLDLSYSMAADDLKPSRYKRAVFAIRDLLANNPDSAPFALITFAGAAYQVTPLSYDLATIDNFLDALEPGLLPSPGSNPMAALELVADTLADDQDTPADNITLVLISDDLSSHTEEIINTLQTRGWQPALIAVGKETSVPVPTQDGKLMRDNAGQLLLARYHPDSFVTIARRTGGKLASIDGSLGSLADLRLSSTRTGEKTIQRSQPADLGYIFVLLLLPLVLLGARRGLFALACMLSLAFIAPQPALAFGWSDLWTSRDNQANEALQRGDFDKAAALTDNPLIAGSAKYKKGDYQQALEDFSQLATPQGKYNAGNAAFQLEEYQQAIDLFQQALQRNPDPQLEEDIQHNLAIAEERQKQQQHTPQDQQNSQQQNQQGQQQQQDQQQQNKNNNGQQNSPQQQQQQSGQQEQQTQQQSGQAGQQQTQERNNTQQPQHARTDRSNDSNQSPSFAQAPPPQQQQEQQPPPTEDMPQQNARLNEQNPDQNPNTDASADASYGEAQSRGALLLNSVEDNPGELLKRMFWLQQQKRGSTPSRNEPLL